MSEDKTTTHERLLQEAATLFARRGYSETSMSDIARAVGVRKASLYNYYSSKADLLIELLEQGLSSWTEACAESLESFDPLEERLAAYLKTAVEFSRSNPPAMAIIRMATAQGPGDLRRRAEIHCADYEQAWRGRITAIFRQAVDDGEIQAEDPATAALFWGVFLDGILVRILLAGDRTESLLSSLQTLWEFFWRGISGSNPMTEISL